MMTSRRNDSHPRRRSRPEFSPEREEGAGAAGAFCSVVIQILLRARRTSAHLCAQGSHIRHLRKRRNPGPKGTGVATESRQLSRFSLILAFLPRRLRR